MSSTSARTIGLTPTTSSRRSKATRMSLSRLGRRTGVVFSDSGNRNCDFALPGCPTRLTGCSASRWLRRFERASSGPALFDRTTSRAWASSWARQIPDVSGSHDQFDVVAPDEWPQEFKLEVARQRRERAHAQGLTARDRLCAQRAQQFVACLEDRIGIVERDPAGFGQLEFLSLAVEQPMARYGLRASGSAATDRTAKGSGRSAARVMLPSWATAQK